jgi:replicative DNA helicase
MDLTELKLRMPIEKLARALGIEFTRETTRYDWASCPFHPESQPSFVVDKLHHVAKCFASTCVASKPMDHVKFVQMYEHLPKELAIDRLYQLVGEERPADALYEILQRALEKLTANIHDETPASFFKSRGITNEALTELRVGYSPSFKWFQEQIKDIPQDQAVKLELYRTSMFDDTIVYPVFDGLGRMAGFRSRTLGGSSHLKYVANAADFPLKPSRLYGLHTVRNSQVVLVEGPNDVLALRSVGVKNTVGMMGTNLREVDTYLTNHGFSDMVFIADGDDAGRIAMFKAPDLVRVNIIPFESGHKVDPDEYVRDNGLIAISTLINDAKFPIQIKLESKMSRAPSNLTGKIMLIKSIAMDLSEGLHPIIVSKMQDQIASSLEISKEEVISIFDLAEFDTSDLESKIIWHTFSRGEMTEDIKSRITPASFADPRYRKQYQELYNGLSPAETVGKAEGLTEGDLDRFLDLTRRRTIKYVLRKASHSISNLNEPLDDVLNKALGEISSGSSNEITVLDSIQQLEIGIQNAIERSKHPGELLGVSFGKGFAKTDEILQGVRPNCMYILAATQGSGKSALGLQWALSMAFDQNVPVLWISLEMSELDMSVRILSKLTGIGATKIMKGELTEAETGVLANQTIKYMNAPLHTAICGGMNIHQIVSLIRKYKALKGIRVVFLDYLQLIDGGSRDQTMYERVGHISRMIKSGITMDRTIGLPVVAIAQLAKVATKFDVPMSEHIAESYKIAQDADAIMLMRRLDEDDVKKNEKDGINMGNMILNIDKNRAGVDHKLLGLVFNLDNLTIKEVIS